MSTTPHQFDQELLARVAPETWTNPAPRERYDLVVVGAGSAGLVSSVGAAGLGAKVALVEKRRLGGDCLNYGCVPSKALLSAARAVHHARDVSRFGVRLDGSMEADFGAVMERLRELRAGISKHDSVERLTGLGVDVFFGEASFVSHRSLRVGGAELHFKKAVLATGSEPLVPPITGLDEVCSHTNETIFDLTELPRRLLVVGGGAVGCELAQAFRRLGSEVTLLTLSDRLLEKDDPDASRQLLEQFQRESIHVFTNAELRGVKRNVRGLEANVQINDGTRTLEADELLLAVGRKPILSGLNLEAAGVQLDGTRLVVDDRLRTTNRRIYAAGDVCAAHAFTHTADAHARLVLHNALFWGRKKQRRLVIPHCTYTDPEVAQVGITVTQAAQLEHVMSFTVPLTENDRAVLEGRSDGWARVHIDRKNGRVLGATLVGPHAGELIFVIVQLMTARARLSSLANVIAPYPTYTEVWKRLADRYNQTRLTPFVRRLLQRLLAWQR